MKYLGFIESKNRPLGQKSELMLKTFLTGMRPQQWWKNTIIYLPILFTVNETWDFDDLGVFSSLMLTGTLSFILFSLLTGATYLMNDIFDKDDDRNHPVKRLRPVASGTMTIKQAWVGACGLIVVCVVGTWFINPIFTIICLAYTGLSVGYSLIIRHLPILDVLAISLGFVLRAEIGSTILDVPLSPWLYMCTALAALLLALTKRRSELIAAGEHAGVQRYSLGSYSLAFLDQLITIVSTTCLLAYCLYTFSAQNLPSSHIMMFTIPFVAYGMFRYLFIVHKNNESENPIGVILSDRPTLLSIALWLLVSGVILVFSR